MEGKMDNRIKAVTFDEEALALIANKAIQNGTGARGLRSQLEKVLENAMYNCKAASGSTENTIHITSDTVKKYQQAADATECANYILK